MARDLWWLPLALVTVIALRMGWRARKQRALFVEKANQPVSFGFKMSWLAFRAVTPEQILEALNPTERRPVGWYEGTAACRSGDRFLTPRIGDWVFLVGPSVWPPLAPDEPPSSLDLGSLSR